MAGAVAAPGAGRFGFPHVQVHVLARFAGDGLLRVYEESPTHPSRQDLDLLAARVRAGIDPER